MLEERSINVLSKFDFNILPVKENDPGCLQTQTQIEEFIPAQSLCKYTSDCPT